MSNCLYEASLQKISKECDCNPIKFFKVDESFTACEGAKRHCMQKHLEDMGLERTVTDRGLEKECWAACVDQTYRDVRAGITHLFSHLKEFQERIFLTWRCKGNNTFLLGLIFWKKVTFSPACLCRFLITQSVYPNLYSFSEHGDFCVAVEKLKRSCAGDRRESLDDYMPDLCPTLDGVASRNESCDAVRSSAGRTGSALRRMVATYARDNMAVLNVYIREPYVRKYETEVKYGGIAFMGNMGGLLGLFTGFSLISAFELVYLVLFGPKGGEEVEGARKMTAGAKVSPQMVTVID